VEEMMIEEVEEYGGVDVGQRLRDLREQRNVSMRSLAKLSGLSANGLSMIERNLTSPSVSTLTKLAKALEVPVAAFFREQSQKSKVVFCKQNERNEIHFLQGKWEGLGGDQFEGQLEAYILVTEANGSSGVHKLLHSGNEFVFGLEGQLEYEIENQRYLLNPGDSLFFLSNMEHRWHNTGTSIARAMIIVSGYDPHDSPGEYHLTSPTPKI
jgi:transcriptional regulator with XRE-family HTH domain